MISRYSRPAMLQIFSDQSRFDMWLAVEKAVLAALVSQGIAPAEAWTAIEPVVAVDVARVVEREALIHHDLAAFVDVVGEDAPGAAAWLHYGLTSSDVVDTALALQLQQAGMLIVESLRTLQRVVLRRAHEHRATLMLGRTHGMPAEPITFGTKLAGWWHGLQRDEARIVAALSDLAVGKLSGAVGLYSGVSPQIERVVLTQLGLDVDPSATQIVQRDRHAALLAALGIAASTLDRMATEIRHLQRSEVGEAAEPFGRLQKGSSAMPHKRNPIVSERICGLARVVRATVEVGMQNVALWHERDISHSSAERVVIPDAFLAYDYMLERMTWLVDGLVVDADQMWDNLLAQRGLVSSQAVLLALVEQGMARDEAYRVVQGAAHDVQAGTHDDFAGALAASPEASAALGDRMEELVDSMRLPAGVDEIFARLPRADA